MDTAFLWESFYYISFSLPPYLKAAQIGFLVLPQHWDQGAVVRPAAADMAVDDEHLGVSDAVLLTVSVLCKKQVVFPDSPFLYTESGTIQKNSL